MVRFGPIPENPAERFILAANLAPTPLVDTIVALLLARTLMVATKLDVFDALADGPSTADNVARRCGTDPTATKLLLDTLVSCRYLTLHGTLYGLADVARTWMLKESPNSLRDATLHRYLDVWVLGHYEDYVRTGTPLRLHDSMSKEQWGLYQRGQRSHALLVAPEVAKRVPVPANATAMLDIGGAHGFFSVAFCRRYPGLSSTILDLPEAIEQSAPILAAEGLGERVRHQTGNAITDDFGEARYDLVLMANVAHHFDDATNRDIQRRVARALKPGGTSAILELVRTGRPQDGGQVGALTGIYFAMQSPSRPRTYEEIASWQRDAGLEPHKPIRIRFAPGYGVQAATKLTRVARSL